MPNTLETGYFQHFPIVQYNGINVKNLLSRTKIHDRVLNDLNAFYPYTIVEGESPDTVAFNYYDSPNMVWLVFLANNIIDPYYQWPLSSINFIGYIKKKYGSIENAQRTILDYENNENPDLHITSDTFQYNNLIVAGEWHPRYAFVYEEELNEQKRNIRLLGKDFANIAQKNLKTLLNE